MSPARHPQARAEARHLVDRHDGSAGARVEREIDERIDHGDVDEALQLDQVRREIGRIYKIEGE